MCDSLPLYVGSVQWVQPVTRSWVGDGIQRIDGIVVWRLMCRRRCICLMFGKVRVSILRTSLCWVGLRKLHDPQLLGLRTPIFRQFAATVFSSQTFPAFFGLSGCQYSFPISVFCQSSFHCIVQFNFCIPLIIAITVKNLKKFNILLENNNTITCIARKGTL